MRKFLFYLFCILSLQMMAQEEKLHVMFNVGDPLDISVNDIKNITFVEDTNPLDLIGSEWFCEEVEENGTYETFEFHEDGTLTYSPVYTNTHSRYTIPGYFMFEDYMLTIRLSIGEPYTQFTQTITNHSETSYVVTSGGENLTYYKVQKVYTITSNEGPVSIGNDGDVITFVDNEIVGLDNNKIKPLSTGVGYALVKDARLNAIVAYRINIVPAVIDWTQYFKKTKDEIIAEFGTPESVQTSETNDLFTYRGIDPVFGLMYFGFDKELGKMYVFQGSFLNEIGYKAYREKIENTYILQEDMATGKLNYYYDTNERSTASVSIIIQSSPMVINFMDLKR